MTTQTTDCGAWQAQALLAASGELPEPDTRALDEHLQLCRECRAFVADLGQLTSDVRKATPTGPPEQVLQAIHQVAAEAARPRTISFPMQLRVALSAAAALAIAVGVALRESRTEAPATLADNNSPEQVASLVWILGDGESDAKAAETGDTSAAEEDDTAIRQLARQLLEMQGFDDEFTDEDALFPELPSTALQSRNTPVLQDQRCV